MDARRQSNGKGARPQRSGPPSKPPGGPWRVSEPQRAGSGGSAGSGLPDPRVLFASQVLVGYVVKVEVTNGAIYEGILHTVSVDRTEAGVVLKMAKMVRQPEGSSADDDAAAAAAAAKPVKTLVIQPSEFVQLTADGVKLDGGNVVDDVGIDAAIGRGRGGGAFGRELQRWEGAGGGGIEDLSIDAPLGGGQRGWDQFEANRRLFGVETSFQEDLYTTKLDKAACGISEAEAARLASEIERSAGAAAAAGNMHLAEERGFAVDDSGIMDEEDKYSAVLREPGQQQGTRPASSSGSSNGKAWVPSHRRQQEGSVPIPVDPRREAAKVRMALTGPGHKKGDRGSSPYGSPLVGDAQRLEALDLNPGLPRIEHGLRREFAEFKKREAAAAAGGGGAGAAAAAAGSESSDKATGGGKGTLSASSSKSSLAVSEAAAAAAAASPAAAAAAVDKAANGGPAAAAPEGEADAKGAEGATSKLNPFAKEFTMNPNAREFKPTFGSASGSSSGGGGGGGSSGGGGGGGGHHPHHPQHHHPGHHAHGGGPPPRQAGGRGGGGPKKGVDHYGGPKGSGPMGPGGHMVGQMPMQMGPQGMHGGHWMPGAQFMQTPNGQFVPIGSPQQQMFMMRPPMGTMGMMPMQMHPMGMMYHPMAGGPGVPGGRPPMYAMMPPGAMVGPGGAMMGAPPGPMSPQEGVPEAGGGAKGRD